MFFYHLLCIIHSVDNIQRYVWDVSGYFIIFSVTDVRKYFSKFHLRKLILVTLFRPQILYINQMTFRNHHYANVRNLLNDQEITFNITATQIKKILYLTCDTWYPLYFLSWSRIQNGVSSPPFYSILHFISRFSIFFQVFWRKKNIVTC